MREELEPSGLIIEVFDENADNFTVAFTTKSRARMWVGPSFVCFVLCLCGAKRQTA
jgi:hypothetical protein